MRFEITLKQDDVFLLLILFSLMGLEYKFRRALIGVLFDCF